MNYSFSLLALAAGLALAGCANGSPRSPSPIENPDRVGVDAVWPYWPVTMRVHPLSRMAPGEKPGTRHFNLRVEFRDRDGIVCRALGNFKMFLYDATPSGGDDKIMSDWNWDLTDLPRNKEYFDDVMRTYLLTLRIDVDPLPELMLLRVYYASANGENLDAKMTIRLRDDS